MSFKEKLKARSELQEKVKKNEKICKEIDSLRPEFLKQSENLKIQVENLQETREQANMQIIKMQGDIDNLKNCPESIIEGMKHVKDLLKWYREGFNIAKTEINSPEEASTSSGTSKVAVGFTAAGAGIGAGGASALVSIATTFGTASTGVAISSLSGAAASNAVLAWLGAGAVAAGGGGMATGAIVLSLIGPIGWSIAGVAAGIGGIAFLKNLNSIEEDLKRVDDVIDRNEKNLEILKDESIPKMKILLEQIDILIKKTKELTAQLEKRDFLLDDYEQLTFPHEELFMQVNTAKNLAKVICQIL